MRCRVDTQAHRTYDESSPELTFLKGRIVDTFRLNVNGKEHRVKTFPDRPLLDVLREDLLLTGTKYGCGEGECRSCTVLMDGRPVASCTTSIEKAHGRTITTIEGLAKGDKLHPLQKTFIASGAMQCGFCASGMILTAVALLQTNPNPSRQDIEVWMNGNICRCCGYPQILDAIEAAAKEGVAS